MWKIPSVIEEVLQHSKYHCGDTTEFEISGPDHVEDARRCTFESCAWLGNFIVEEECRYAVEQEDCALQSDHDSRNP